MKGFSLCCVLALGLLASINSYAALSAGRYVIVSKLNGNALDVANFSTADGADVMQWFVLGGNNQQFDVAVLSDGSYSIRAVHSGKALDLYGWNQNDGAEVRQWTYTGADNQRWYINDTGNNYYSITAKLGGRAMDVWQMNMFAGAEINMYSYWGGAGQLWAFQKVGSASECVAGATLTNRFVNCGGKTIGLSCAAGSETQPAVLTLKNASVANVKLSASGGSDGIHCSSGNCTLANVVWNDICEDAATNKSEGGTMTIVGGSAYNASGSGYGGSPDKIFQHNSKNSTTIIAGGFTATGTNGKLWRSCGNCSSNGGPRNLLVYDVNINGAIGSIAGVNRNFGDKATIRRLKIKSYVRGKPPVCEEFNGVQSGSESTKYGEYWNTANCAVATSDVTAL